MADQFPQGPIPYRPAPEAPKLTWPGGNRVAVWIIPNIEWYSIEYNFGGSRGGMLPDVKNWSIREYGARVGVWRLMEAMDIVGARATVALNAWVCDVYPQIIEAGNKRDWEWMGHGLANTRPIIGRPIDEEREEIRQALDRIEQGTGARPQGWLGPGLNESPNTRTLLQEAGLKYIADWPADDRPFPISTDKGWIAGVPYSLIHNDTRMYDQTTFSPSEYRDQMCRAFDVLYRESERSANVFAIPIHPHLSGYPARTLAFEELLRYVNGHPGVWWATGSEIADSYLAQEGLPSWGPSP